MLKKLRLRLTLVCAITTAAILCAISLLLLGASEHSLMQSVTAAFEGNIAAIAYRLQSESTVGWDWLSQMETDQQMVIAVEDQGVPLKYPGVWRTETDRGLLVTSLQKKAVGLAPGVLTYTVRQYQLTGLYGELYLGAAASIPAYGGRVRTAYLIKDLSGINLTPLRSFCLVAAACSVGALAAFAWWFSGRAIRPVEQSVRQQNEFVAAASHELRSPLATMRANASVVKLKADASALCYAEAIDREGARLGRLVEDLLTLAAADAGRMTLRKEPVEAEALLCDTLQSFAPLAEKSGVALRLCLPKEMLPVLTGDAQRLLQMLSIFVDNALRYVPRGGEIVLAAARTGKQVMLRVQDNGPGIPDEEKTQVFRRFYRADPSRSVKEHYGLGLPIAADIARRHGGTLTLTDTPAGGLTVTYRQNAAGPSLSFFSS